VAGRPAKDLVELVRDRSFRARRDTHRERLADAADLQRPRLSSIQRRYRRARRPETLNRIALEFERAVQEGVDAKTDVSLLELLEELGPFGSAERASNFFPRFLRHTKGPRAGDPFELDPFQKAFLREAFRRHPTGRRVYTRVYLFIPGGNGKTPIAAGLGLLGLAELQDAPEIYCLGPAKDTADIALHEFAVPFVKGSDEEPGELAQYFRVRGRAIINEQTGGKMRVLPASGPMLEGKAPSIVIPDELHAFEHDRQVRSYVALSGKLHKRQYVPGFSDDGVLYAISTAGRGEDQILRKILLGARAFPRIEQRGYLTVYADERKGILVWSYEAPHEAPLESLAVIRKANPASWIDPRDIVKQLHDLGVGEAEFRRLARNEWIAHKHAWLPIGAMKKLKVVTKQPPRGAQVVLAFDGSYNNDSTALIGWTKPDHLFVVEVWERPEKEPEWVVPRGEVGRKVDWAMEHWDVQALAADPPGWYEEIEAWTRRYGDVVHVKFLTNEIKLMSQACREFYAAVVNTRKTTWDGDERLARHLANARVKETDDGAYIVKDRRDSPNKIDAAVGAVIARFTGLRVKPKKAKRLTTRPRPGRARARGRR